MKEVIRMFVALPKGSSLIGGLTGPISFVFGRDVFLRMTTVPSAGFSRITAGTACSTFSGGLTAVTYIAEVLYL